MTRYSTPKLLTDIVASCEWIRTWTDGMDADTYRADDMTRSAVERKFEIIGEALSRLERSDPETAGRIEARRQVIGFRNRLAHGDDELNHPFVLQIAHTWVPRLETEARRLLEDH